MPRRMSSIALAWGAGFALSILGCGESRQSASRNSDADHVPTAPALRNPGEDAIASLTRAVAAVNPNFMNDSARFAADQDRVIYGELRSCGLTNLQPLSGTALEGLVLSDNPIESVQALAGLQLRELDLAETKVSDLSPLSGMPLEGLWLNHAPVSDLTPLQKLPLKQLSLEGTNVSDVSPLSAAPLESLWLNGTKVTDLAPLEGLPLVSLTLQGTAVDRIDVVRTLPSLQRLHLGETRVSDLRPLKGLRLTRLIVTPANIREGWDVVRGMDTLTELDIEFRQPHPWSPQEFWRRFDAGEFSK